MRINGVLKNKPNLIKLPKKIYQNRIVNDMKRSKANLRNQTGLRNWMESRIGKRKAVKVSLVNVFKEDKVYWR